MEVSYEPAERRFVGRVPGHEEVAFIDVMTTARTWTFVHTEVPRTLAGGGVGSRLVRAALDHARSSGVMVVPACPFVAAYLRRHTGDMDLVPERFRRLVEDGGGTDGGS